MTMKKCSGPCGMEKPVKEFNTSIKSKDGYQYYCRECQSKSDKQYRKKITENKQRPKLLYLPQHISVYNLENYYKPLETTCGVYTFIDYYNMARYIGSSVWIGREVKIHIWTLKGNTTKANKEMQLAWDNNIIKGVGLLEICRDAGHAEEREYYYNSQWPQELYNKVILLDMPEFDDKFIKRFWKKANIKKEDECWEWTSSTNGCYGLISYKGQNYCAHRVSFKLTNPNKLEPHHKVRHLCNNKLCVNPSHLIIGSLQDNARDKHEVKKYEGFGEEKYLTEWYKDSRRHSSIGYSTFISRICTLDWPIEKALTTPVRNKK